MGNARLGLARAALRDWDRLTPRLRAVALRQEAHAYALLNEGTACARSLDRAAEQVSTGRCEGPEFNLTTYCTAPYLMMEAAACWLQLNQPRRSVEVLEQGLKAWRPEYRRDLGLCLARLARAHAAAGEADEAYTVAQRAVAIVQDTRSARTLRELDGMCTQLAKRDANPNVAQLVSTLASLRRPQAPQDASIRSATDLPWT